MTEVLKVVGLHCRSCELLLQDALSEIGGISNISVDSKKGEIRFDAKSKDAIESAIVAIEKEGYTVAKIPLLKK
ncbi:MAG: heavy metal-associated domain-containing protein [Candidatus Anstonellales archaeon]